MTKFTDEFGDRMKMYESESTKKAMTPGLPIIARLDGVNFSNFTKVLKHDDFVFHDGLIELIVFCAKKVMKYANAKMAYMQSDEISFIWDYPKDSQTTYAGRFQKWESTLAAKFSVYFNNNMHDFINASKDSAPIFDCRVWQVPNDVEAMNAILWRQQDCRKNSISMVAQAHFSHKELHGKSGLEKREMLKAIGIDYDKLKDVYRNGTLLIREDIYKHSSEFRDIPELFRKDEMIRRTQITEKHVYIGDLDDKMQFFNPK